MMFSNLSDIARKTTIALAVLYALVVTGSIVFYRSVEAVPFVLGALLGSGLNVYKVIMIDDATNRIVGMEPLQASNYVRLQYLIRLGLSALVLLAGAFLPLFSLWGVGAGLLTLQPATYYVNIVHLKNK
ncbi:MAG: hypothetical protein FWE76_05945 [Symbiobacteriaceae bacterium]|nr:hypothetical protein [Symbiobacteriaceae bacterium]